MFSSDVIVTCWCWKDDSTHAAEEVEVARGAGGLTMCTTCSGSFLHGA